MNEKPSRSRPPSEEPSPPRFEEALGKLQESVSRLEAGELDLSDALACYEQGIRQLKVCYELLEDAERRIELLCGVDAEGNPVTQPYDDANLSLEEKRENRGQRRTHRPRSSETASSETASSETASSRGEASSPASSAHSSARSGSTASSSRTRASAGGQDSANTGDLD